MSNVYTAKEICERALRAIGAFPVTESAADGEQLREAMSWLDLILGQNAGTGLLFNLIPSTITVPIVNGTQVYPLNSVLGASLPIDDIQFPVRAFLQTTAQDGGDQREPIEIAGRNKFEDVSDPDETGRPCMVYIDQLAKTPTLSIFPTPAATDSNAYKVLLDVQTYAPNVSPSGVTGITPASSTLTNFRQSWQRYHVAQLSHDLGTGPIFKLPEASLNRFAKMASDAKTALEAFENREHTTEDPVCEPHGM